MIDWDRVEELKSEIGEEDFAEVLELFLAEMEEGIAAYDDAAPHDRKAEALHALKGSAANVGFSGLADICRDAEATLASGQDVDDAKARLSDCFAASRDQMSADAA